MHDYQLVLWPDLDVDHIGALVRIQHAEPLRYDIGNIVSIDADRVSHHIVLQGGNVITALRTEGPTPNPKVYLLEK
jgi:hypothetical protein